MRSIVLAVLSLLCIGAGVLTTPIPVVGTVFSFSAPALALLGVILGGVDLSRRRRAGQSSDGPLAGVILSALCFLPALATSLTCGVCNALWSSAPIEVQRNIRFDVRNNPLPGAHFADGGVPTLAPPPFGSPSFGRFAGDGGVPEIVPGMAPRGPSAVPAPPSDDSKPRPAPVFPPPPLPPGPLPSGPRSR